MKKIKILLCFIFALSILFCPHCKMGEINAENEILETSSKAALLYDARSGEVVYQKNGDKRLQIASMTKLASLKIIFDAIEDDKLSEDTLVKISKHAAETGGSSAFLDEGSEYRVGDLIMTVIVCSANDSTVALAEAVCGSEFEFVKKMNELAKDLRLKNTMFSNCTGLPVLDHYSSAYDISKIYTCICNNKIYKKYSKIWNTELVHPSGRKTDIVNTNRLIKTFEGCDGGKTGYTADAGYCLAASATRGGMTLIGVVIGAKDSKMRFNEMSSLFNFGFKNYENKLILNENVPIFQTDVRNSLLKRVDVYANESFVKFLKKGQQFEYSIDYVIKDIVAPKVVGDKVGEIYILDKNQIVVFQTDLVVRNDIEPIKLKDILKKIYSNI